MNAEEFKVDLRAPVKPVIRAGLIFQGVLFVLMLPALVIMGMQIYRDLPLLSLLPFGGCIFFFFIARRYLGNVFFKEYLLLTPETISVVQRRLGDETRVDFAVDDIKYFSFAGFREYTSHPMDNKVVDFTGLGTTERELQFLIDDGTIEIETSDKAFRFGKNVPSWEAEEVIAAVEGYLKKKFISKYPLEEVGEESDVS